MEVGRAGPEAGDKPSSLFLFAKRTFTAERSHHLKGKTCSRLVQEYSLSRRRGLLASPRISLPSTISQGAEVCRHLLCRKHSCMLGGTRRCKLSRTPCCNSELSFSQFSPHLSKRQLWAGREAHSTAHGQKAKQGNIASSSKTVKSFKSAP